MRGHAVRLTAVAMAAGALLTLPVTAAHAAASLSFDATLNGRSISSLSNNDPLVLRRGSPLRVAVTVHNATGKSVTVAAARVQGRVMGLSFFSYDTQLNLVVAANSTRSTRFEIALTGLADQADGLLPSTVELLNGKSDEIASKDITVDVKGDLNSIYGVFGLAIAAITLLWLVSLLYRVSRRALPADRWRRAVQFSAAGFGVGLALTFSVSALRLLAPGPVVWAPFVFGAGVIGLAVGYITPGPRTVDPDEEADFIAARERQHARVSGGSDAEFESARAATAPQRAAAVPQPGPTQPEPQQQFGSTPLEPQQPEPQQRGSTPPAAGRETTVQAARSDLDSIFGSGYGAHDRDDR